MRRLGVIVVMSATVLAGCGGGGGASTTGAKQTAPVGGTATPAATMAPPPVALPGTVTNKGTKAIAGDEIEIEADDFYFEPTFVRGEPGKPVRVKLRNEGRIQHTFTIDGLGVDEVISPVDRKEIPVTLPARGNLNFYCRFHRGQGMQGAIFVP